MYEKIENYRKDIRSEISIYLFDTYKYRTLSSHSYNGQINIFHWLIEPNPHEPIFGTQIIFAYYEFHSPDTWS